MLAVGGFSWFVCCWFGVHRVVRFIIRVYRLYGVCRVCMVYRGLWGFSVCYFKSGMCNRPRTFLCNIA